MDWTLGLGLALVLAAYAAASTLAAWHRLRHIPGPPGAGFSKWWMLRNTLAGNLHLATKAACREYGPLVRVGPNQLVTDDPDVLRRLWAVRSPYKKGPFYDAVRFNPERDNLVSMRDDQAHAELRAKMAPGYAGKENDNLETAMDREIGVFLDLLERRYVSTAAAFRPVDLARKVQYLTLDVITALAFGRRFGYAEHDADLHAYIRITEASMPVMMLLSLFPALARLLQARLLRRLLPSEHDRVGFGPFIAVARRVVADRLAAVAAVASQGSQGQGSQGVPPQDAPPQDVPPPPRDMLASFLAHGLTRDEAEGETLLQIVAGSDTTATALRATLLHLMASPSAYRRLAAEVRAADAQGRLARPVVAAAQARALPYLQAVVREGLRIHPPVAGTMDVVVPKVPGGSGSGSGGGDLLCGYPVPAGTEVGCSMFGLQTRPAVFGPDADMFRPERWLEAEAAAARDPDPSAPGGPADRLRRMTATWGLVFKYGKWQCLGKDVALLELNKVLVELLRRYDFALVNPGRPWHSTNAGIFIQSGLFTKITRVGEAAEGEAEGEAEES